MNKLTDKFWFTAAISFLYLATPIASVAQVTSDGTLSTEVTTLDNLNFTINGGNPAGGNLFHSFRDFSVPNSGSATFNNASDVQNIISRVTGSSISNIDGLIRANGSANLFLINPNGIIFGSNAALQIGGSLLASTANRLNFADGSFFSTTNPQTTPLLTISVPTGLQFGETVGDIRNQSQATRFFPDFGGEAPVGLEVGSGKTLVLVGGNLFLAGGGLYAPGGRVELGSVASNSLVSLNSLPEGWILGYEGVQNFQDIQLSNAFIDTGGETSGDIQLQGRQLAITDNSQVVGVNLGAKQGGAIALKASDSVVVSGGSQVNTGALFTGAAGEITIETRRLSVGNGSFILAATENDGQGGNLTVNASEFVEIDGSSELSQLTTQTSGSGDAGDLRVTTGRLILRDGGQIISSTRGSGNGGTVFIDASESVEATGRGVLFNGEVRPSGLLAETAGSAATGSGGILRVDTRRLLVKDGARVSVAAVDGSTGQAGSLDIDALDSVEISGNGSSVLAASESPKPAGDLKISTDELIVKDGAEVSVSSKGTGNAGDFQVEAGSIRLDDGGKLTAISASGEGGNIRLNNLDLLLLRGNSEIATDATAGAGNGGNINIDTDLLAVVENSKITADAVKGNGGNIRITTQGLFRSPDSAIRATSQQGIDGVIEINRPDVDPSADLVILPAEIVDISGLIAQGCLTGGRNIAASEFVITGRGGLPPNPAEATRSDRVLADLGKPVAREEDRASAAIPAKVANSELTSVVEANSWVFGSKGEVVLTATAPSVTADIPWLTSTTCRRS